jgi:arsenate reductase
MLTFYGYKQCGTCRKAEKALEQAKVKYDFIDVTENPPPAQALKKMVQQAGVNYRKLFNTSGVQYREQKIKDKLPGMSEADVMKLLAGNGRLIKRPIVTDGKRTTIGFSEAEFKKTWKRAV